MLCEHAAAKQRVLLQRVLGACHLVLVVRCRRSPGFGLALELAAEQLLLLQHAIVLSLARQYSLKQIHSCECI